VRSFLLSGQRTRGLQSVTYTGEARLVYCFITVVLPQSLQVIALPWNAGESWRRFPQPHENDSQLVPFRVYS
jgi:hypothetical protein